MKQSWVLGLDAEEKEILQGEYRQSQMLRRRMVRMLEEKALAAYKARTSKVDFNEPNWALKQADAGGYARAMQEVADLLK